MTGFTSIPMPEGYDLRAFDVVDSTNAECRRMAAEGARGNIWVAAATQSAGRGRRGRAWRSARGNLFASLLYAIDCDLATASQLSFVAALAVRDMVADLLPSGTRVCCKWPNDILVEDRKISGILLESTGEGARPPDHVIIGVGVNIASYPDGTPFPATSLKAELGRDMEPAAVMRGLAQSMAQWVTCWRDHGFPLIRATWKEKARGLGDEIIVRLPEEELRGRFVDLDDGGALILEFAGERRHITAGDVFFV